MKRLSKIGLNLICLFVWFQQSTAQTTLNEWVPYFENETINIELQLAHRADTVNGIFNNYLLIRIANKTETTIAVSFQKQLSYNQVPVTTDTIEPFILQPRQVLTGSTDPVTDKSLRIFVNQEKGFNKKVLTDYSLMAIQTEMIVD